MIHFKTINVLYMKKFRLSLLAFVVLSLFLFSCQSAESAYVSKMCNCAKEVKLAERLKEYSSADANGKLAAIDQLIPDYEQSLYVCTKEAKGDLDFSDPFTQDALYGEAEKQCPDLVKYVKENNPDFYLPFSPGMN